MRKIRIIGSALVTVVVLWGAASNIAPKVFAIRSDRDVIMSWLIWLWNPSVIWIALPLAAAWFALLLYLKKIAAPTLAPIIAIPQAQLFQSQGFSWELTHNFWPLARSFSAEDNYISTGMIGPLCPQCSIDVSDDLRAFAGVCHDCRAALHPAAPIQAENNPHIMSAANSDPLWPLRKAAYRDAQRAMRRGDITAL